MMMTEFGGPLHPEENELENNQIETGSSDQKLATLRSYLHWYDRALLTPKKYLGKERLSQKEQEEIAVLKERYQQEINDYIQRQIEEEADRLGVTEYPEDIKAIEPPEFSQNRQVELLSEMMTPQELAETNPIGKIDPPLAVNIYLTDLALPAPTGKIPVKSLPFLSPTRQSEDKINIFLPQSQKSVPCPLETEVIQVIEPESARYQKADALSQLEPSVAAVKYQLALRMELPKVDVEKFKPSPEEMQYWQSVFPLPRVLQRLCRESPEDIPSYIGSYVTNNFCYVTNPDFGEFLQYAAEDLPIIMQELKVGHCDYLSWYTAAVLRSLGIPAWIGGGKIPTTDRSHFNGSYNHAVVVYAKADGSLGEIDPTSACAIDFAYHPKVLTKKDIDNLDDRLSLAETDEKKRQILADFKKTIEQKRELIHQNKNLEFKITKDWADAIILNLKDFNPDALRPRVNPGVYLKRNFIEFLPTEENLESLIAISQGLKLDYWESADFIEMTRSERERLKRITILCQKLNICFGYKNVGLLNLYNKIDRLENEYSFEGISQEYSLLPKINPDDLEKIGTGPEAFPSAFGYSINCFLPKITDYQESSLEDNFYSLWQRYSIDLLFVLFIRSSFDDDFITLFFEQANYQELKIPQEVGWFIKNFVILNFWIQLALAQSEKREDILKKIELKPDNLDLAARRFLSYVGEINDYESSKLKKTACQTFDLASSEELKLSKEIFPRKEWHLSQNQYGMPVPGPSAREYQPGDEARYIHWKATAKQPDGKIMVREFEPEPEGEAAEIYLDRNIILSQSLHDYMGALGVIKAIQSRGENNNTTIHIIQHPEISRTIRPDEDPDKVIEDIKDQIYEQETTLPELPPNAKGFFISTSRMKCAAVNYFYPGLQTICLADEQYWLFPEVREDFVKNGIK